MNKTLPAMTWRRLFLIGLLAIFLAGCGLLRGNPVPDSYLPDDPVSLLYGVDASGAGQWLQRDEKGVVVAFLPLKNARAAVAKASAGDAVSRYATPDLEQARAMLASAEQAWQAIAPAPLDHPQQLVFAANKAHQAKRHAQIAIAIAARETGLKQLFGVQQALRNQQALRAQHAEEDARWLGQKLIPGRLGRVRFAAGTAELTSDSAQTVAKLVAFLRKHPRYGLQLVGHTDDRRPEGDRLQAFLAQHHELAERVTDESARVAAYKKSLSLQRARALRSALVAAGIDDDRLWVAGHGGSEPIADNATAMGRRENRRVVAIVVLAQPPTTQPASTEPGAPAIGKQLIPGPLGEVHFGLGTARLTQASMAVVENLAEFLRTYEHYGLRVIGHTDNTAPSAEHLQTFLARHPELAERETSRAARVAAYNQSVSVQRARALRDALVQAGIDPGRILVEGRGASEPIADNATAAGRRANRRIVAIAIRPQG